MSTISELKIRIVSVVGSEKNGCTGNDLCRIYKTMYGKDLEPEKHGFKDLNSLLVSPVMQGKGGIVCRNGRYFAAGDENTEKMLKLVRNTKSRNHKSQKSFARGGSRSFPVASLRSDSNTLKGNRKLPEKCTQVVAGEVTAKKQIAKQCEVIPNMVLNNIPQVNPKAELFNRHIESSFENQTSGFILPLRASNNVNNYQAPTTSFFQQNYNYNDNFLASTSAIQRRPNLSSTVTDGKMKSQKGKKRLVKIIEQHGGNVTFSEVKNSYLLAFSVPLDNAEICRLFGAKEKEIQDLYEFLKNRLYNDVVVTKCEDGDLFLRVTDDEDDIDAYYSFESGNSAVTQRSLEPELAVLPTDTFTSSFRPNQYPRGFEDSSINPVTSSKTGISSDGSPHNSHVPVSTTDSRYENWNESTFIWAIRSRDDYLPYRVLGDKVLSFIQSKGSFKVCDLSEIFYEEDGRHIDPSYYLERTWENVVKKLLSSGRYPELTLRDGVLDLREDYQKSVCLFAYSPDNRIGSIQNKNEQTMSLSAIDNSVPVAIIYDLLMEAGRPLHQKELLEKLNARDVKVNICELTVKLLTKFNDVFCCKFNLEGILISLAHGAKRPEEQAISSCMPSLTESVKIVTHVMSDYRSTAEPADSIFKPVLLINIVLTSEPLDRFRIQTSFRLRSFEREYISFEKKMCYHYLTYGQKKDYAVEKPIKDCHYAFHDTKDNQVYRVQFIEFISGGVHDTVALIYLIDQMRYQVAPVSQLKKLRNDYTRPSYGVVAKSAPFIILPGKKEEFDEYFSLVCSKLLTVSTQDIQVDVVSEPSENLFELKQLYSEAHGDLNVPAIFVRQNLIQIFSSNA